MVHKLSASFLSTLTNDGMYCLVNSDAKMPQTSSGHVQIIDIHIFITTLERVSWLSIKKGKRAKDKSL